MGSAEARSAPEGEGFIIPNPGPAQPATVTEMIQAIDTLGEQQRVHLRELMSSIPIVWLSPEMYAALASTHPYAFIAPKGGEVWQAFHPE
jgi:hypothetical protein